MTVSNANWIVAAQATISSYRRMIDELVSQLNDEEFFSRPASGINSVAIILRHLGGNLQSRWTDFLTTDGEKPNRNRDQEFLDWDGDRNSLIEYFETGWNALENALESINDTTINGCVRIRGEAHTVPQAISRSLTHLSYHVGQIAIISRMVHVGDWNWLTIAPGKSNIHNETTWGSPTNGGQSAEPSDGSDRLL